MPGKMIPVKGRSLKSKTGATKGADKKGNKFIPDWKKPKGNRRRVLDAINEMNKEAGY